MTHRALVPPMPRLHATARFFERIASALGESNPVLLKELRVALRTPLYVRFLYLSAAFGGLVVLVAGAQAALLDTPPAVVGRVAFELYCGLSFLVATVAAPILGATTIALERETLTLDSLTLTQLSAGHIVRGKFLAVASSILLLLVASLPVGAVAFLFGGVSPWEMLVSCVAIVAWTLPGVALGMALSSRLTSTRVALMLALVTWVPLSLLCIGVLWAAGADAYDSVGPFWFAAVVAARPLVRETIVLAYVLPTYVVGSIVWFGLAAATAGLLPATHDRSAPLKRWFSAFFLGLPIVSATVYLFTTSHRDVAESGVALQAPFVLLAMCGILAFMGEPLVAPRHAQADMGRARGPRRLLLRAFGSGAPRTLRFVGALVVVGGLVHALMPLVVASVGSFTGALQPRYFAGAPILAAANVAMLLFFAALAFQLRAATGSGIASRIAWIGAGALLVAVLPLVLALATGDGPDDWYLRAPIAVHVWPVYPALVVGRVISDGLHADRLVALVVPLVLYSAAAGGLWLAATTRARVAAERDQHRRQALLDR